MKNVLGQRGPERLLFCPRSLRPSVNELILESRLRALSTVNTDALCLEEEKKGLINGSLHSILMGTER